MRKSDISPMPPYFGRYIKLVEPDVELKQAFDESLRQLDALNRNLLAKLEGKRYAPGKWTVKDHFQHLADVERVLSYRALLFARGDRTVPPGFDVDFFAVNARADKRTSDDLIGELKMIRRSTQAMFESFDDEMLLNIGINWKDEMSVLAMGLTIVGHQIHHVRIIEEKYLPLLNGNKDSAVNYSLKAC